MYVCVYICMYYTHTHTHTTHVYLHPYTYTCLYIHIHTYIYIYTHTYIYIYIYTHTHIQITVQYDQLQYMPTQKGQRTIHELTIFQARAGATTPTYEKHTDNRKSAQTTPFPRKMPAWILQTTRRVTARAWSPRSPL